MCNDAIAVNCAKIIYEYNTNHNTVLVRCVIIILFGVISRIKKMDYWPEKKMPMYKCETNIMKTW